MSNASRIEWLSIYSDQERKLIKRILSEVDRLAEDSFVFPRPKNVFRAFDVLPVVKVVIVGQDPYHGDGQANGYAFAVNTNVPIPPSLNNIFKELRDDVGEFKTDRTLVHWANQGVMLLNAVLTVSKDKPASHQKLGWQQITNRMIKHISDTQKNIVFILWGKFAQSKSGLIDDENHLIITSAHPSPLSAYQGFFGSKPFSRTNQYLSMHNIQPIEW